MTRARFGVGGGRTTRRLLWVLAVLVLLAPACSGDDDGGGGGDEAAATSSTEAETDTTTAAVTNWCSAFQNFAGFVAAATAPGQDPSQSGATFEEQADFLAENLPTDELEDQFTRVVDGARPAFAGQTPTQEQLDQQGAGLDEIGRICGFG